ncbi:MAG: alpha-hydroxy acid oxidase [Woeseiaceae bacterium]
MDQSAESQRKICRRQFLQWMSMSSLALSLPINAATADDEFDESVLKNIFDLERLSGEIMGKDALDYLNGGADDLLTVKANHAAYRKIQIRPRRLIDVSTVSTNLRLFGVELDNPIVLGPVGLQRFFHDGGEIATAKAAINRKHQMVVSTVSNFSVGDIASQSRSEPWFQLYPTPDRNITKKILDRASAAGCKVCFLTVDTPVIGNRENHGTTLLNMLSTGQLKLGNFEGILPPGKRFEDPSMTWDMIDWLRNHTDMQIVLKGIVTREDARLAREKNVDGIVVSNHGGRQLESLRATIDCLPEVVAEVDGSFPVLVDGGIRRGTDIFKALALGATAVCIGRPYCWGLGAMGQQGVEIALKILKTELVRDMQLAGTTSLEAINRDFVQFA